MSERRPPVNLRGPHVASEIIGYAYRIYVRNFRAMFAIGLTTVPLRMLSAVVQDRVGGDNGQLAASPIELIGALVTVMATGALIYAVNDVVNGQPADFNRALDAAFSRFWALFVTNLLSGILTVLSIAAIPYFLVRGRFSEACSVPYFAVRWNLSPQAVMIEEKQNWAALDASSSIVKGQWWRTLGIVLLLLLVALVPLAGFGAATALPPLAAATIVSAGVALVVPFVIAGQTLLYYDLRTRSALGAGQGALPTLEAPGEDAGAADAQAPDAARQDGGVRNDPDQSDDRDQ